MEPSFNSVRTGAIGVKVGMMSTWDKWGNLIPLTMIHMDRNQVVNIKTKEKDGYSALQIGAGQKNLKNMPKSQIGLYLKSNIPPKSFLKEFKITEENTLPIGYMVGIRHFTPGQFVSIQAKSKGKGFQGVMQRWGFKGLPASHGHSLSHRSHGSTGGCQDPGRVFKGKKMAGRGGHKLQTNTSMLVYRIDYDKSLLYVKGSVPGANGSPIYVSDGIFSGKKNIGFLNYPTFIYEKGKRYASIIEAEAPKDDPTETWLHENAVLKDDNDGGED